MAGTIWRLPSIKTRTDLSQETVMLILKEIISTVAINMLIQILIRFFKITNALKGNVLFYFQIANKHKNVKLESNMKKTDST